jgi:hypothetical protein
LGRFAISGEGWRYFHRASRERGETSNSTRSLLSLLSGNY